MQLIRHLLEPVDISKKVLHDAVNLILLRVKTSFEMRIHSREWMSHIFSINLHSVIKIKLRLRFWSGKGDNSHARWGGCAVFFTLLHQLAFRLQGNTNRGSDYSPCVQNQIIHGHPCRRRMLDRRASKDAARGQGWVKYRVEERWDNFLQRWARLLNFSK